MTYSIVAFDTRTGEHGVAVASCVPLETLQRVPGIVERRGAFVTQSYLFDESQTRARDVLQKGANADATVAALVDPTFDSDFDLRQYAVIDGDGGAAAFTGKFAVPYAAHRTNRFGPFVYSVQGNILNGAATLENMEAGFAADVCDMPERLLRALETAGFDNGGDNRCSLSGHPAQSALVRARDLAIDVDLGNARSDPARSLRSKFDEWRKTHPCATPGTVTNTGDRDGCHVTSSCGAWESWLLPCLVPIAALLLLRRWRAARRRAP